MNRPKPKRFLVTGTDWNYSEPLIYHDADSRARDESENSIRFVCNLFNRILYIYYDGVRYIPSDERICENCDTKLAPHQADYSYQMTGHFFCTIRCGIDIGALTPNKQPDSE